MNPSREIAASSSSALTQRLIERRSSCVPDLRRGMGRSCSVRPLLVFACAPGLVDRGRCQTPRADWGQAPAKRIAKVTGHCTILIQSIEDQPDAVYMLGP